MPAHNNTPEKLHRVSIRLPAFDYAQPGAYFLTVCAAGHMPLFGLIEGDRFLPTRIGLVVECEWLRTKLLRSNVCLDAYVVMPNHFHAILIIDDPAINEGTARRAPTVERFGKPTPSSVPTIMRAFKSAVSRRTHKLSQCDGPLWQREYYEHVIRDERDLGRIRDYILTNPERWQEDHENPACTRVDTFYTWLNSFRTRPPARP